MTKLIFCFILTTILLFLKIKNINASAENHPGHGKKFGSSGPFLKIDQKDSISTKIFFQNYVAAKKALLLRNAVQDFPAFTLWSDKYLRKIADNLKPHENTKLVIETEKKESREQEIINMSLGEFLDSYQTNDIYMVNEVPFYLKKDIVIPQPLQCNQAPDTLEESIMWFSSGGTKSVVHTDDYENILCIFDGIKEIVMVDSYKFKKIVDTLIDEPKGSYSSMDVDNVDYVQFPGIENLEYYHFNLTAGDCLYIPLRWLHQIRSYNRNLAINFWFNYDKIFHNSEFSDKCKDNKLDLSKTMDKFEYNKTKENEEDTVLVFRQIIIRQFNMGRRNYTDWKEWLFEPLSENEQIDPRAIELAREFFNYLDFDGNGVLTSDEIIDLDENKLEQIFILLNEIESINNEKYDESNIKNEYEVNNQEEDENQEAEEEEGMHNNEEAEEEDDENLTLNNSETYQKNEL